MLPVQRTKRYLDAKAQLSILKKLTWRPNCVQIVPSKAIYLLCHKMLMAESA